MKVEVLGSGIIALSTAIRAQELGHQATIRFTHESGGRDWQSFLETAQASSTSWAAAAFWTPFATGDYQRAWALDTLHRFRSIAGEDPDRTGVTFGSIYFYFRDREEVERERTRSLWWAFDPLTYLEGRDAIAIESSEVSVDGTNFEARVGFRLPIVEMSRYLPYLVEYAAQVGVTFESTPDLLGRQDVFDDGDFDAKVVACGGWTPLTMGFSDDQMTGLSGQIFEVSLGGEFQKTNEVHSVSMPDDSRPAYIVANSESAWLGGTAMPVSFEMGKFRPDYQAEEESRVVRQVEQLAGVQLNPNPGDHQRRIGIRPYRNQVRVERIESDHSIPIIVNYGHGGAGISLSWGCANEAVRIMEAEGNSMYAADEH